MEDLGNGPFGFSCETCFWECSYCDNEHLHNAKDCQSERRLRSSLIHDLGMYRSPKNLKNYTHCSQPNIVRTLISKATFTPGLGWVVHTVKMDKNLAGSMYSHEETG